jgi:hypothetical protein
MFCRNAVSSAGRAGGVAEVVAGGLLEERGEALGLADLVRLAPL